jgi:hypothetical protein
MKQVGVDRRSSDSMVAANMPPVLLPIKEH